MSTVRHVKQSGCPKCKELISRYPGFDRRFEKWFFDLQRLHPEAHIATAGVDEADQETLYHRKATRRRWKSDPANWNAALSIFNLSTVSFDDGLEIYWASEVIERNLPPWLDWSGWPGRAEYEPSLVFLKNWQELAERGDLTLIGDL